MTRTVSAPAPHHAVPDSEHRGLVGLLPRGVRGYALLSRWDRPIGWWLLFWPSAWALALGAGAAAQKGGAGRWDMLPWFLLGSIAMRGAGCSWNDLVDRDLDARVARTASRPIPAGLVSPRAALAWTVAQCLVGLVVLVQLTLPAAAVALGSIALVAAYPFMKRITWWPQAWLGLVFSWAAAVAWVEATGGFGAAGVLLYVGSVAWVIGYDTIYALQDREDDALVGVRSSALALGGHVRAGVAVCYAAAVACWGAALWQVRPDWLALLALAPAAVQLGGQVVMLRPAEGEGALELFRSNRYLGLLVFLACAVVGAAA